FLPDVALPETIRASHDLAAVVAGAEGGILVPPSTHLRAGSAAAAPHCSRAEGVGASTGMVAACKVQELVHSVSLRVYSSADPIGVQVGGAIKNVLAIATGACAGLQFGTNARAALIPRGVAEIPRLGVALGADALTFLGMAGVGDL